MNFKEVFQIDGMLELFAVMMMLFIEINYTGGKYEK